MEHPFFPTTTTRAEALRWLTIAEKLLSARDLMGSKSFASRARESDPTLTPADQILAVADTLLAGDRRIGNNQQDWYAILRIVPAQGRDSDLIANQYRSLALMLNPQKNKFPFAEQAFRLIVDAWSVLSNPSRKSSYDKDLSFYVLPQQQQQQPAPFSNTIPIINQNFMFFGGSSSSSSGVINPPAPQQPQVHFQPAQVHVNSQVDPVDAGSTREPPNFVNFNSGSNIVFGPASGSKPIHEPANKKESFSAFSGNVPMEAPGATQEPVNANNNNNSSSEPQQNHSNVGGDNNVNAKMNENVGERVDNNEEDGERVDAPPEMGSTFWTSCPYCYYMYQYSIVYVDATLRCQNCKKAFQAVAIPSPPPVTNGREGYFCCWGFLPMGFSRESWEKSRVTAAPSWTPFSPMFTCPQGFNNESNVAEKAPRKRPAPKVYIDEDDVFVDISDSSESDDVEWQKDTGKQKKKAKTVKGKGASGTTPTKSAKKAAQAEKGNINVSAKDVRIPQNVEEMPNKIPAESGKKGATVNYRKQPGRVAKNFGKLDLNVEFSNEPDDSASKVNRENGPIRREEENIEGIGFFEGLDEFLSSLPILNVADEKVVKAA